MDEICAKDTIIIKMHNCIKHYSFANLSMNVCFWYTQKSLPKF